jgi:hypothetical protein
MRFMDLRTKRYFFSAIGFLGTYAIGWVVMNHELHPTTTKQILAVITLPLGPAAFVSTAVNLKWMRPYQKKYFWRFAAGMTAYVLGLDLANHVQAPPSPYNFLLVLLPVVPLIYVCSVIIRYIAESDEMWRKIYMEAWAFTGVATGFTCCSYLFLRDMGAPVFHAEWAFYLMWVYYCIGLFFSRWRYR